MKLVLWDMNRKLGINFQQMICHFLYNGKSSWQKFRISVEFVKKLVFFLFPKLFILSHLKVVNDSCSRQLQIQNHNDKGM